MNGTSTFSNESSVSLQSYSYNNLYMPMWFYEIHSYFLTTNLYITITILLDLVDINDFSANNIFNCVILAN